MILLRILHATILPSMILICCSLAVSQETPTSQALETSRSSPAQRNAPYPRQRPIVGRARIEAGKTVFTGMNGRTWTVLNPESLNGLEGKRMKVIAEVHRDNSIRVLHVITYGKHVDPTAR